MKKNTLTSRAVVVAGALNSLLLSMTTFAEGGSNGEGEGSPASQAMTGVTKVNTSGASTDLIGMISIILNSVFGVIGIVAVVMIVMGGVNYTISQGDPGKIKKAKDTILYGIVGLVIALLAFAIVSFVLSALQ